MTAAPQPRMHGATHVAGGSDPIPGLTGGGDTTRVFGAGWAGPYLLTILTGAVWKVPKVEGADVTFNLDRILFRLETPGTSTSTVRVEKSSGGGAFSASTVATLSLSSSSYETSATLSLGTVSSGDLLRIVFTAAGTNARGYLVMIEGTAA